MLLRLSMAVFFTEVTPTIQTTHRSEFYKCPPCRSDKKNCELLFISQIIKISFFYREKNLWRSIAHVKSHMSDKLAGTAAFNLPNKTKVNQTWNVVEQKCTWCCVTNVDKSVNSLQSQRTWKYVERNNCYFWNFTNGSQRVMKFQIHSLFEDRKKSADYDIGLKASQNFIYIKYRWNHLSFEVFVVFIFGNSHFEVEQRFGYGHRVRKCCIDDAVSFGIVNVVH